jgi:hypothetical protein
MLELAWLAKFLDIADAQMRDRWFQLTGDEDEHDIEG